MKVLLRRRHKLTFGQDQRAAAVADRLDFAIADVVDDTYRLPGGGPSPSLIVSFNSHQRADVSFANQHQNSKIIVHLQLRTTFLGNEERTKYGMASVEQEHQLLKRATHVIVPARFMIKRLADDVGIDAISCIRNGVDTEIFRPPSDSNIAEYRAALDIPNGACVIAFLGQLTNAKGWQILREVAKRLPPKVFLVARSLPPYKKKLDELRALNPSQIRVQEENNQNRELLPSRYADALLITSLSEVAPLVLSEALASGVPTISTDCTPFFGELETDGFGTKHISLVSLPSGMCDESMDNLKLKADQSEAIASCMVDRFRETVPISNGERMNRYEKTIAAGIEQDQMLNQYAKLYSGID